MASGAKAGLEDHDHWRPGVAGAHWEDRTGGLVGGAKRSILEGSELLGWRGPVRRGPRMEGR